MSTTLAQFKAALTNAQATYAQALNAFVAALVDLESLTVTVESCGGGPQIGLSRRLRDNLQELLLELQHPTAAPITSVAPALKASGITATSSPTLAVASVPAWVAAGMTVTDATTSVVLGTVLSAVPGSAAITLTANSAGAVAVGDSLLFGLKGATGLADHVRRGTAGYTAQWSGS
jgi:hypothetical protein